MQACVVYSCFLGGKAAVLLCHETHALSVLQSFVLSCTHTVIGALTYEEKWQRSILFLQCKQNGIHHSKKASLDRTLSPVQGALCRTVDV